MRPSAVYVKGNIATSMAWSRSKLKPVVSQST